MSDSTATWSDYVPVLRAGTTNPALGSGSLQKGRYCQIGKLVVATFQIQFGTSGATFGAGIYSVSVPVAPNLSWPLLPVPAGNGYCGDWSTGANYPVDWVLCGPHYEAQMRLSGTPDAGDPTHPFTFAAQDIIVGSLTYEAA